MNRIRLWMKERKLKKLKHLRKIANRSLREFRFSYGVAEDILKDSSIRYYNGENVEILDAKKLRLSRI